MAALTIASTGSSVRSPCEASIVMPEITLASVHGGRGRRRIAVVVLVVGVLVATALPASAAPSWKVVAPVAGAAYGSLSSVSCATTASCFAVGAADTPSTTHRLVERWNGTSWTAMTTPSPPTAITSQFTSVHCRTSTSCVAVGQYGTAALHTKTMTERWNGTAWSLVGSPNPIGIAVTSLAGVQCTSATFCIAVGSYFLNSSDNSSEQTLVEQWNGMTWKIVASPNQPGLTDNGLTGVSCVSATDCTAVGHWSNDVIGRTLVEHWNGTKWSIVASPSPAGVPQSELTGVTCRSAANCFAVGSGHGTLVERWNGSKWSMMTTPNPTGTTSASLTSVSCPSATRCVAVGDFFLASAVQRLVEEWNGGSWSITNTPAPAGTIRSSFSGVSCAATANCISVGQYQLGTSRRPLIEQFRLIEPVLRQPVHSPADCLISFICSATAGSR